MELITCSHKEIQKSSVSANTVKHVNLPFNIFVSWSANDAYAKRSPSFVGPLKIYNLEFGVWLASSLVVISPLLRAEKLIVG
jgi:hypothetical protein